MTEYNKPTSKQLKVISMLDCLYFLSKIEAEDRGTEFIIGCDKYKNGEQTYLSRMWDEIRKDCWGNQQFNNDSFYRWTGVSELKDPDIVFFVEYFGEAINYGEWPDDNYILFDVCW